MRKIKIENGKLTKIFCPIPQGNLRGECTYACAWFHIETLYGTTGTAKDKIISKTAYCKDHRIGEIE